MTVHVRKLLKWALILTGSACLLLGLTFGAFGIVVSRVPEYRVQLQNWINERGGIRVEFKKLSARMRLYGPELVFDQAIVRTPDGTRVLATTKRGSVAFDLWSSIGHARLTAGRFSLESPELGLIRTKEGRIQLLGLSALPDRDTPFALEELPMGRFHVRNAVVSFRDAITGRGPWSLSGVELRRDARFWFAGAARRCGAATHARSRAALQRDFAGPLQDANALVSAFSVEGEELDLAGWADVLPDAWPAPETGHGSIELRGVLRGAELVQLAADVDLSQVAAAPPTVVESAARRGTAEHGRGDSASQPIEPERIPDETDPGAAKHVAPVAMLSYPRLAFGMRAEKIGDTWHANVSNLNMARPTAPWLAARIEGEWMQAADGRTKASGKTDRIVLDALWPLLAYLPESDVAARLRSLNATGTLSDVWFEFERDVRRVHRGIRCRLARTISFAPVQRTAGASGLSGAVQLTQEAGELKIASDDVRFELPHLFREPLAAQDLAATVRWHKSDTGWTIESNDIRMSSPDGRATARFNVAVPGDGSSPVLDISAQGTDLKVSSTHKYIPAGRLGAKTMEWFDRAFLGGRVVSADLTYRGSVRDFPFRKDEGLFLVRGHVEDALFDYQPGWVPASNVTADLEFRNEGMHIRASVGGPSAACM